MLPFHKQASCQPWLKIKTTNSGRNIFVLPALENAPTCHGVKCDNQSGAICLSTTYFVPGLHACDALLPLDCTQHRSYVLLTASSLDILAAD